MNLVPQRSSLVAQTVAILKEGIRAGLWKDFLPGEMALCHRLQVSRVTLRAALEQLQREQWCSAGQGRRRRIQFALARHVSGNDRKDRVVLLSPHPLQNLTASALFWVDALREHLATTGHRLEYLHSPAVYSQHPERALEGLVHKSQAAGWVLYLSTHALQRWFSERGLPCVICGSRHADVQLSSVDIDYAATCSHATGLLVAGGRNRLALLMPRSEQAGNIESEHGFLQAVERHSGVKGQVAHHDGTTTGICGALDRLLRGDWAINGLLVAKPAHVVTAVSHLLRRGIRLPQDVGLLSRDDDPLLEHLVPVVSRYHFEPEAFARRVSRLVVDLARAGAHRRHDSRIIPKLIRGETLG